MSEQLRFDGFAVENFGGRFQGTFDLSENYALDSEITFLVVGRVNGANITTTKTGDLKRTNVFDVLEVAVTGEIPTSRRMVAAAAQIPGQLTIEGDGKWDEDEDDLVSPPQPVQAPQVQTSVSGVPTFGRKELYSDDGWAGRP